MDQVPTPVDVPDSPWVEVGDDQVQVPQGLEVASPVVERVPPVPEVAFRAARWLVGRLVLGFVDFQIGRI